MPHKMLPTESLPASFTFVKITKDKKMISRRQLLYFSVLLSILFPFAHRKCFSAAEEQINENQYPLTLSILKEAYREEMTAKIHYDRYCQKSLSEKYPNTAYLFLALSTSEKIHANNYKALIGSLGSTIKQKKIKITPKDTKSNLNNAAVKELEKINVFYPDILKRLSSESHDQAIISCMYSWKSHQQHEKIIKEIKNYSGIFFTHLSKKIEQMSPNYYVCEICGSTIEEKPEIPCEICNYSMSHYNKINRPTLGYN